MLNLQVVINIHFRPCPNDGNNCQFA